MSTDSWLPDVELLQSGLSSIFGDDVSPIAVLDRYKNMYASTSSSEIVTCQFRDGRELDLFIKYGKLGVDSGLEFKGNIRFEAAVYEHVLQPLPVTSVAYYGTFTDEVNGYTWLVLAYLGDASALNKSPRAYQALSWGARWLGQFHAASEARLASGSFSELKAHTVNYYEGWVHRLHESTRSSHGQNPWLPIICEEFEDSIPKLLSPPQTIVHGEYYPVNILVDGELVYPIDWQTAAIARGELDLACLIEGWGDGDDVRTAIDEYCNARWQQATPSDFAETLSLAQLFWPIRWLVNNPKWPSWTTDGQSRLDAGLEYLHLIGERAGLI